MDSDTDTCILVQVQHIVNKNSTKMVSIIDFDKDLANKNDMPFVAAMTLKDRMAGISAYSAMKLF